MSSISILVLTRSMAGQNLLDSVFHHKDLPLDCHVLTFNPEASDEIIFPHLAGRIKHIDKGSGVLVLVDTDATHGALIQRLTNELQVCCVTGLNVAMLQAINDCVKMSLIKAAEHLLKKAKLGINLYHP